MIRNTPEDFQGLVPDSDRKRLLRALRALTNSECKKIKESPLHAGEREQVIEKILHMLDIELTETERNVLR